MTTAIEQGHSEMVFVDRSTAAASIGAAETLSLSGNKVCASMLRHDLGVDSTRTKYTGIGKFCMPAAESHQVRLDSLARAVARPYTPPPSKALPEAAFDYRLHRGDTVHSGSYAYDGDKEFDRSLAPFDLLVREIVRDGEAVAGLHPTLGATLGRKDLLIELSLSNSGRVDVTLTGLEESGPSSPVHNPAAWLYGSSMRTERQCRATSTATTSSPRAPTRGIRCSFLQAGPRSCVSGSSSPPTWTDGFAQERQSRWVHFNCRPTSKASSRVSSRLR